MIDRLEKMQKIILKLTTIASASMLLGIVICIFLQVIFRYILSRPLAWSEELARFLFAWCSMLGAAAATKTILAQGIDVLYSKFPGQTQNTIDLAVRILSIITCLVLIIKGFELTGRVQFQTSSALGISMSIVYMCIPVAAIIIGLAITIDTIVKLNENKKEAIPDLKDNARLHNNH